MWRVGVRCRAGGGQARLGHALAFTIRRLSSQMFMVGGAAVGVCLCWSVGEGIGSGRRVVVVVCVLCPLLAGCVDSILSERPRARHFQRNVRRKLGWGREEGAKP